MSIIIPVRGSTSTVEVFNDELPENPTDVIDLLRAELAPLDTWCDFAVAYHCQGRHEQFREILRGVVDAFDVYEMQDFYRRDPASFASGQLRILNLLAASATHSFTNEQLRRDIREAWRQKALEYIGRADKISTSCPQTWLVKALFWIGEHHHDEHALGNAGYYADSSLSSSDASCVASLAKAAILFHEEKFADALKLYVKALRLDPRAAGTSARVGVGLCAYHLGDFAKATAAFDRVLSLDPTNVEALAAMAVLRLDLTGPKTNGTNKSGDTIDETEVSPVRLVVRSRQRSNIDAASGLMSKGDMSIATDMLRRAIELNPSYSIALNHYANYLFWKEQKICQCRAPLTSKSNVQTPANYNKDMTDANIKVTNLHSTQDHRKSPASNHMSEVDELASRAYHCTTVPEIQAEAYFILGRNNHVSGNIEGALPYYTQACKLWPSFALAQFRLAQIRTSMGDLATATEAAKIAHRLAPHAPEVLRLLGILYLDCQSNREACNILQLAVNSNRTDPIVWLALANAQESVAFTHCSNENKQSAIKIAIDSYRSAINLQIRQGLKVPQQVLNNLGALQFEYGDLESAAVTLHLALDDELQKYIDRVPLSYSTVDSVNSLENPLFCLWEHVGNHGVWLDRSDSRILWTNLQVTSLLHQGDVIRIGHTDFEVLTTLGKIDAICNSPSTIRLPGQMSQDMCAIHLSEPIRLFDDISKSRQLYRLRQSSQSKILRVRCAPVCINLAQLYAMLGANTTASELVHAALQLEPRSTRCLLLLAQLNLSAKKCELAHADIDGAIDLALSSLGGLSSDSADALAVACSLQCELNRLDQAYDMLHKLRRVSRADAYASLNLGWLHLCKLLERRTHATGAEEYECRPHQLAVASDYARAVLHQEPSCSMAAHLLGLSLMELGQLDDAGIIFERVRDGIQSSTHEANALRPIVAWDATVNLAHSCCLGRRWTEAVTGYSFCLKTSPMEIFGTCCRSVVQSSRAHLFKWLARALYGAKNIHGTSRALAAAVHLQPANQETRFHSAVVLLNKSLHVKASSVDSTLSSWDVTAEPTHDAVHVARDVFSWLGEVQFHDRSCQLSAIVGDLRTKCDTALLCKSGQRV
jgi:RNA polymerase-associated protein CTR9